jgi:phosphoserine phosphatase
LRHYNKSRKSILIKLAVFDFDSTLMDGETIDFFAEALGIGSQVRAITERAMNGELDFFESLQQRVGLLKGLEYNVVEAICHNLPYMNGAIETIAELKKRDIKVVCFSGGFRTATSYAQNILEYDADFSNILHVKEGKLTGLVGGDMMFDTSKGDMLRRLQGLLGVREEETMVVGDGANDRSMFAHAGTRVAFCAKEILKKEANIIIETQDLTQIITKVFHSC